MTRQEKYDDSYNQTVIYLKKIKRQLAVHREKSIIGNWCQNEEIDHIRRSLKEINILLNKP
jgi:hypothetical protein